MKLPIPSWLTLSEAVAWLVERGVSDDDAKAALQRAFRNNDIATRARSKRYHKHNLQGKITGLAWDRANIDWDSSAYSLPDREGAYDFSDVEVSRDDLFKCFGSSGSQIESRDTDAPSVTKKINKSGRPSTIEWHVIHAWITTYTYENGLPDTQADLEEKVLQWCEVQYENPPGLTSIKEAVRAVFQQFKSKGLRGGN